MATQTIDIKVVDKTGQALRGIQNRIHALNTGLLGINRVAGLATAALAGIGGAGVLKNIVQTTARFQDLKTTLNTVTGGAREGADAFKFVNEFATQTQFGVEELTTAYIKLKSNGLTPTKELLTTFTDAAAVTTDQLGSLTAITDFYTRSLQSQSIELTDLERLAERGLPVYDILKEKLGKARGELTDFSKTAGATNLIIKALTDGINERFGGATEARINNVSTQFSNLQIAIATAADAIGSQGFAAALGETAVQITNFLNQNQSLVKSVGLNLTKAFLYAKEGIVLVIKNIDLLIKAFGAFIALKVGLSITGVAIALVKALYPALLLATKGVQYLTKSIRRNPLLALGGAIAIGIAEATGALDYLFGALQDLGNEAIKGAGAELQKGIEAVEGAINGSVDGLEEAKANIAKVNTEASRLQAKFSNVDDATGDINNKLQDTNTTATQVTTNYEAQADALGKTKTTFKDILAEAQKNATQAQISLATSETQRAIKAAELDLNRALTEEEKKKLTIATQARVEANKQLEKQKQIKGVATDIVNATIAGVNIQSRTLEAGAQQAKSILMQQLQDQEINYGEYYVALTRIDDEYRMRKEELDKALEDRITAYRMQSIEKQLTMQRNALSTQLSDGDRQFLQRQGQEERQQQIVKDRIDFEKKSEAEKYQFGIQQAGEFFSALGQSNKKAFEAAKMFNIANAIMNTYLGATKALATYPPPFNFIAAAAVVASGLAQVASIRSQQYQGRQRGGALQMGRATVVGEDGPELIVPKQPGTVIPREVAQAIEGMGGGGGPVTVNFNIETVDAQGFDQLLVSRRGTITNIINGALQQRGKEGIA